MDRNSPEYQKRKWAWELCHHPAWEGFLRPLLALKAQPEMIRAISSLDDAFAVAQAHAQIEYARFLLATIESKSAAFEQTRPTVSNDA